MTTGSRRNIRSPGRLTVLLETAPYGTVVTVFAGRGYGKTTLLEAWRRSLGGTCVLLTGSPGLTAAHLEAAHAGVASSRHGVLLVDNADAIVDPAAMALLAEYVDAMPGLTALVVAARIAIPVPLGRRAAAGQLIQLWQDDLELTATEMTNAAGLRPRLGRVLTELTGGWPLAAGVVRRHDGLPVQTHSDLLSILQPVADLVLREDLSARPPVVLDALLRVALLGDAGDVRHVAQPQQRLWELQGRRPIPLTSRRQNHVWVAPLLRNSLLSPKAAEQSPYIEQTALELARALAPAGETERAMRLTAHIIDRRVRAQIVGEVASVEAMRGFHARAQGWLRDASPSDLHDHPQLVFGHVAVSLAAADLPRASQWLALLKTTEDPSGPSWGATDPRVHALLEEALATRQIGDGVSAALTSAPPWSALAHILAATQAIAEDRLEHALGLLRVTPALSSPFPLLGGWRVALNAYVLDRRGSVGEALEFYRRVRPELQQSVFADERITFLIDSVMGRLAWRAGDLHDSMRLLKSSTRKTQEIIAPGNIAILLARLVVWETAIDVGDGTLRDVARREAQLFAEGLSAVPGLRAEIERLNARSARPTATMGLTPAQRRVLGMLASPYAVPRIAAELFLSPATVRSHIRGIYTALGVNSRGEAVDMANRLGLLPATWSDSAVE